MKLRDDDMLVLILAIGVFGILNTEMGVVGLIPSVSERFAVSVPDAGLLVSAFALIVSIAGPTMPLLFSRVNRKHVMLLALGVFTVCNAASVFAPSFEVLLAARVIPAAFHPLYVSMAMAIAQQVGETASDRVRNSARVFVGVSAGMVVGAPVAGALASALGLSAALAFFAAVTAAALVMTVIFVPSMPVAHPMSYRGQLAILKRPVVVVSLLAAASVNAAMFGFYSYLSDYLGTAVGMTPALVSMGLLAYGLANIAGNALAGRALGASARVTMVAGPTVLAVLYLGLFGAGSAVILVCAALLAIGVAVGVANTCDQYMVSRSALEAPDFANGLFLTATNLGTTMGASICGSIISAGGVRLSVLGTLPLLAAGLIFTVMRLFLMPGRASGARARG